MSNAKHLKDLKPDPQNARRHTPRGLSTIERSLNRDGFGRSLLVAEDGTIIAGNATAEAAAAAGLERVRVIDSDGTEVIAIRRTDIKPGTSAFANLAIADNRAGEHSDFDPEVLQMMIEGGDIDPDEFWFPDELDDMMLSTLDHRNTPTPGDSDDDPEYEYTEADDMVFWPEVKVKVPPATMQLYMTRMQQVDGTTEHERFKSLLEKVNV